MRSSSYRGAESELEELALMLNEGKQITPLFGAGCAGARDEIIELARTLKAPIVHALRGKEFIEYDNPYDVGMTGLIGFSSGYAAMKECDTLLMLGTDFPYRQFYPTHARIFQIDIRAEALGNRCSLEMGLVGQVKPTLQALLTMLEEHDDHRYLDAAVAHYRETRADLDALAEGGSDGAMIIRST